MNIKTIIRRISFVFSLAAMQAFSYASVASSAPNYSSIDSVNYPVESPFEYINTAFENASPVDWELDSSGTVNVSLVYDHERSSPNRANSHWHFQVQAKTGSDLRLVLKNFDNIWNSRTANPISERTSCIISTDGKKWRAIPTKVLSDRTLEVKVHMEADSLFLASVEPYRISDLKNLISEIKSSRLVEITNIGKTVQGRPLEIIRIGNPDAPYRVALRGRAHGFEAGGNWVIQGLIRKLVSNDAESAKFLKKYCVYILPMANKDAVARGRSRFNSNGRDLNRQWDKPSDPKLTPENHALENWLKKMISAGKKPDLFIDVHNDNDGHLHISRPNINLEKYLANMKKLELLLKEHTWFTEGSTGGGFRNSSSIGEGLLERYGIDAVIYEFNYDWIPKLKKVPLGKDWEQLGGQLPLVFYEYFDGKK